MMKLKIDFHSDVPVYKQIIENVEDAILSGKFKEGDDLPSIRKLALDANVNPNTVAKAYFVLQAKGFVYSVSGIGYKVAKPPRTSLDEKVREIEQRMEENIRKLARLSMSKKEIEERIHGIIEKVMTNGGNG